MLLLQGVAIGFGGRPVLAGVDLEINAGETHVILGRSGSGKSVLLKIICGLLTPDAGSIVYDGVDLTTASKQERRALLARIQMLFQGGALFDSLNIAHNVAFHAIEHGKVAPSRALEYSRRYLEMVNLTEAGPQMPSELSGGMRKRAALARALAAEPTLMLYDEPTTGLDPLTSQVINQLIRETQQRIGVTSIVVTHDLHSANEVGDRVSFLEGGRILETTTPDRLSQSPHELVRSFVREAVVVA